MKILMLLENPFPPDPRVEKEILSLVAAGHYVYLLCVEYGDLDLLEKRDGWEIIRVKIPKVFFDKVRVTFLAFPLYFQLWNKWVSRFLKQHTIDAIHVHDLPLSKVAIGFSEKYNFKLVLDQHEYFSDWIVRTSYMNSFVGKLIRFFSDFKKYEKQSLDQADLVITVTDPLRVNYVKEYSLSSTIITIPNTPTLTVFNTENVKKEIVDRYKDDFILFYAGGIDSLRGIDMAIEALSLMKSVISNAKIILGGKLTKAYDPFQTAKKFNVEDSVEYVGWINERDLPSYIKASGVCFFTPDPNNEEINNTIATKNYQYAMMGCPQLVSNARMIKAYVESNEYGYAVDDAKAFSRRAIQIFNGEASDLRFDKEGLNVWEKTVKPMINAYSEFS